MEVLKSIRRLLAFFLIKSVAFSLRILPLKVSIYLAETLGKLSYYLFRAERNRGIRQCQEIIEVDKTDAERIVKKSFERLGRKVAEALNIEKILKHPEANFEVAGEDILENAKNKQGGIVLTAHYGNWELLASFFAKKGYPITVIARDLYDNRLNRWIAEERNRLGIKTIFRNSDDFLKRIIATLKSSDLFAILIDTGFKGKSSIEAKLGKRVINIPRSITKIVMRKKPDVFAVFFSGDDRMLNYKIEVINLKDYLKDEETLVKAYLKELKRVILNNPEEWIWWLRFY